MQAGENGAGKPDPEVVEKPQRRRSGAAYKLQILRDYEASPSGERGRLLRQEGLYSSHISSWQKQRAAGELEALGPKKRSRKAKPKADPELEACQRENERLQRELAQARKIIEAQKNSRRFLACRPLRTAARSRDGRGG